MMLLCVLPFIILLFAGGKLFSAGYFWPILIGVFVIAHFWIMLRGHRSHSDDPNESKDDLRTQDGVQDVDSEHKERKKHGGCCH
ncbi:MAG: hypothetical protein A3J67_01950 [Parcubacteria group bacterium RIFCSPHIGHO2_02_FULL_48_10b]|nr:MAG: hypothetical protein A3J67_01950 [Parcubacteria group bacterium RIFCSPHIGHO2_02_FULL_48_10b]